MSEAFVYYRFYEIGRRIDEVRKEIVERLEAILKELDKLISDARKEWVDPMQIDNMITTFFEIKNVADFANEKLGYYSKLIVNAMINALQRLLISKMCTFEDFERMSKEMGKERALVECYKQNVVACRDTTKEFTDLREGEKVVEAIVLSPDATPLRLYVKSPPVAKQHPPSIEAVYEKCLGVKVRTGE
jgi:hypothetical protein